MAQIGKQIEKYIILKGMTIGKFETKIGVSNGTISKCIKHGRLINSDTVAVIISTFDDINPVSLLTGQGDLLKSPPESKVLGEVAIAYLSDQNKEVTAVQQVMEAIAKKMGLSSDQQMHLLAKEINQVFDKLVTGYNVQKVEMVEIIDHYTQLKSMIKDHFNIR